MSISLAELASRFAQAADQVEPVSEMKMRTVVAIGEGIMKQEIQAVHAVDTGAMLNSVTSEKLGPVAYAIGPTVSYAPYVALGTSRMPARPFHITSARKLQSQIPDILKASDLGL